MQMQCAKKCSITSISKRSYDQTWSVAKIFIAIRQRRIYHSCDELVVVHVVAKLMKKRLIFVFSVKTSPNSLSFSEILWFKN